jgi:hypothetical protein
VLPGQPALLVHASPAFAPPAQVLVWHSPPVNGHWAALVHTVTLSVHRPVFHWHGPGFVVQDWKGALLQVPGPIGQPAAERHTANGATLQFPDAGQSLDLVQAWLVLLHWPPMIAQSLTTAHSLLSMLQWPMFGQLDCCMQLAPLMLQAPGCGVQSEFWVQLLVVWILHLPGSVVHTGGWQFVIGVQVTSGSGF